MENSAPKRILVIDGGAMRGLGCLMIIDEIMKAVITRARKRLLPCEVFDIICGTSVGGFISILLGRLGMDSATAIKHYEEAMKLFLIGRSDKVVWDYIAQSQCIDTTEFSEYLNKVVGDITGSPDVSMKVATQDGDDPRRHPSTKTFVTIMEDALDYPSCTHILRSYALPKHRNVNRHWTIPEVAIGTMASPLYCSPLSVKADKERRFQDAGFGGYNNPIDVSLKECQSNWPRGRIETVISLGTGLRGFLPDPPPQSREWAPIPPYVRNLCNKLFQEKLPTARKDEDVDLNITYAIRELARIAADSSVAHYQFKVKRTANCNNYYRIDEPFGLDQFDLVDVFKAELIRDSVNSWLRGNGAQIITEIANQLVPEGDKFEDKEAATYVKPPPPPPGTVKGYSPLMDEPRPTRIQDYLRDYEVLFIVDDSASMIGDRWTETHSALIDVAVYAFELCAHTVSLRFLNDPTNVRGLKGSAQLKSIFDKVSPTNGTPTGFALKMVFDEHLKRIEEAIFNGHEYSKIPPLDIIVLTDGVPTDNPAGVIAEAVKRLKNGRCHPNTMGIQFVQIGNEEKAQQALKELVKGNNGSIVDTVPYRGVVTSEMVQRILLGGMHPNVRALLPVNWLAT